MGATKQTFMDGRAKVEMTQGYYNSLPKEMRDNMDLKSIDKPNFPYEDDEGWLELRSVASKAYRKLKDYEYKLIEKYKSENKIND